KARSRSSRRSSAAGRSPSAERPAGGPSSVTGPSLPAGDGFALPGSRSLGCLLVHGFTATPDEMRPFGEALARRGFPVRGVRLAGHGTSVADLARTGAADWIASVEAGRAALARDVAHVALVGMSLGALLALHLAATE